jgi:exosome complex component RRP43
MGPSVAADDGRLLFCYDVVINLELPPLCSSRFLPGKPSELAQSLSEFLDQIVGSRCDLHSLCIAAGSLVWVLYVDLVCLSFDGVGSVVDASLLALAAALRSTRLPSDVSLNEAGEVHASPSPMRMALSGGGGAVALSASFAVIDHPSSAAAVLVADPTAEEEAAASTIFTIVVVDGADAAELSIGGVMQPGGAPPLLPEAFRQCAEMAKQRWREWRKLLL